MRALTVKQPWAWAIIHAGKDVENRTRNVAGRYRGPLLIHASLTDDTAGWCDPLIVEAVKGEARRGLFRGAIIGIVDLIDAHQANHGHRLIDGCCNSPWAEQWAAAHLVLANPRPFRPIFCRGALGLWKPLPDTIRKVAL